MRSRIHKQDPSFNKPIKKVMLEDGTLAYEGPGHRLGVQDASGKTLKRVGERQLTKEEMKDPDKLMLSVADRKAEYKDGSWRIREKSVDELLEEKIITPEEAAKRGRKL